MLSTAAPPDCPEVVPPVPPLSDDGGAQATNIGNNAAAKKTERASCLGPKDVTNWGLINRGLIGHLFPGGGVPIAGGSILFFDAQVRPTRPLAGP